MGIVFLSPLIAAHSSQGNFFFLLPLGLRFPQVLDPLSLFFSLLFYATRDLFVWVLPFSHPQLLLSLLKIFFFLPVDLQFLQILPSVSVICINFKFAIFDICIIVFVRFYDIEIGNSDLDELANLATSHINDIYIYINKRFLFNCAFWYHVQEYININDFDIQQNVICGDDFK